MTMELANQTLGEALEKEANDLTKRISNLEEDIGDEIKKTKKELKDTIDTDCTDLKRKIEFETNEIRCVSVVYYMLKYCVICCVKKSR